MKVQKNIVYFGALRAIERSDVVLVVLDGEEGIIQQDKKSLDMLMIQGELLLSL